MALNLAAAAAASGCGPALTAPGDHVGTIRTALWEEHFLLHVPTGYQDSEATPLVVAYHAGGGSADGMADFSGFSRLADAEGFIVAYPDDIQDPLITQLLLAELKKELNADDRRVYAVGFSAGGFLVHSLPLALPGEFAAVACVAGTMPVAVAGDFQLEEPLPAMIVHGTADEFVPWTGSSGLVLSAPETVAEWVRANGASVDPVVSYLPDLADDGTKVRVEVYGNSVSASGETFADADPLSNIGNRPGGAGNRREVVFYSVEGGGHAWPGSDKNIRGPVCRDFDCTRVIWDFFEAHPGP